MEDKARFAATPHPAPERAALSPRTGRRHRPGVRARPRSEALPLRDSAGITPASLGTAPPRPQAAVGWPKPTALEIGSARHRLGCPRFGAESPNRSRLAAAR